MEVLGGVEEEDEILGIFCDGGSKSLAWTAVGLARREGASLSGGVKLYEQWSLQEAPSIRPLFGAIYNGDPR